MQPLVFVAPPPTAVLRKCRPGQAAPTGVWGSGGVAQAFWPLSFREGHPGRELYPLCSGRLCELVVNKVWTLSGTRGGAPGSAQQSTSYLGWSRSRPASLGLSWSGSICRTILPPSLPQAACWEPGRAPEVAKHTLFVPEVSGASCPVGLSPEGRCGAPGPGLSHPVGHLS